VKWRDAEASAWLFGPNGRREVHLAFEPVEGKVARRFAFGEDPPSCDARSELVEALTHQANSFLHGRVVDGLRRALERLGAGRESPHTLVDLLARQRIDLGTFLRSERRKRHQRGVDRSLGCPRPAISPHAAARRPGHAPRSTWSCSSRGHGAGDGRRHHLVHHLAHSLSHLAPRPRTRRRRSRLRLSLAPMVRRVLVRRHLAIAGSRG